MRCFGYREDIVEQQPHDCTRAENDDSLEVHVINKKFIENRKQDKSVGR
jgi:hypothetical protein